MRGDIARREALKAHVRANFSWDKYARATAAVYEKANSSAHAGGQPDSAVDDAEAIYFDLTTTFHASGHPTGIARVEGNVLEGLMAQLGDRLVPIVWSSRTKSYLRLSHAQSLIRPTLIELEAMEKQGEVATVFESGQKGGRIIVVGGSWIRNVEYISALQTLKSELGATLSVLVHDLIQMKLAHLYPDGVGAEFERNARIMMRVADNFLTYSDCSQKDLLNFVQAADQFYKPIARFRLGDMTSLHDAVQTEEIAAQPASPLQEQFAGKTFAIFVSSIEIRKNHALLVNVWRRLVEERGSAAPHLLFIGRS